MKNWIVILLIIGLKSCVVAQDQVMTTFILVRHAEKANDGTNNPPLSEAGVIRADALADVLNETKIDAIFSTSFLRTTRTVKPLATAKGLSIQPYDPMNPEELDLILQNNRGSTIVFCGHSNTTPAVINHFVGKKQYHDFEDSDYDNLIILTVIEKGNAKVTWLNFGEATN